jgi:ribose transport system permease protein
MLGNKQKLSRFGLVNKKAETELATREVQRMNLACQSLEQRASELSGGNIEATMMSGVNVRRTQLLAYVISGFGMAVASLILLSKLGAAHPTAADGYNMTCVAVVFLGSTMFREGEHNLLGSLFGALIMGVLVNGMTLMNIQYYYQNIAQGTVILLAVAVSSIMRAKKK